ncbi:MAG: hypothetical protein HQ538_06910 [Parcubacteria group bacterium]|nr:hypothetical protein [Parcubacteria group bacterium]
MFKTLKRWAENIAWLLNHPAKICEGSFLCQYCNNPGNLNIAGLKFCGSCLKKVMDSVLLKKNTSGTCIANSCSAGSDSFIKKEEA